MKNFLKNLRPAKVKLDARNLHPSVSHVLDSLHQRNYAAVEAAFDGLPPGEVNLLLEGVTELVDQDDLLDEWYNDREGPDLSALLRGTILRKRAWFYRGGGHGYEVTEDRFTKMHTTLREAQASLSAITHNQTYGAEACARLINVHKGLSSEWIVIDDILKQMQSMGPVNLTGEIYYLNACCEKWLGSHDKMFAYARARADDHPLLGALVASAHYERHMYHERFDENLKKADQYRANPDVLNEIFDYQEKLIHGYEPDHGGHVLAHNIFAGVLSAFLQYKGAAPSFALTRKRFTPYPWFHETDELLAYNYKTSMGYKKAYVNAGGLWPEVFAE